MGWPELPHAINVIPRLAIFLSYQTVDIALEAREFPVEISREFEIVDDGLVEAFTGDQKRNARRIRGEQHRSDPAFQVVDWHTVDFVVRHPGERL